MAESRVPDVKPYVLGFLFSPNGERVVLIRKSTPLWQYGLLNGLGGKVNPDHEMADAAMRREFMEEAGVPIMDWQRFATLGGRGFVVAVFRSFSDRYLECHTVKDDEVVLNCAVCGLADRKDVVDDLRFLVPLALQADVMRYPVLFPINDD